MYRVIFKHYVAPAEVATFIAKWKASSDIIQKESGALGSRLFKQVDEAATDEMVFFVMADWENKADRAAAIAAIKTRDIAIEGHTAHVIKTVITEYELVDESSPTV